MKSVLTGILFLCVLLASRAGDVTGTRSPQKGMASWYGKESRLTASGERYNSTAMTAAHRTLPFGTMVRVTNLSANCSAVVRINDRGPFGKSRLIDVSKAAAKQLKMIGSGTASVQIEVVELAER